MSKRVQLSLLALACFLLGFLVAQNLPFAQAQDVKNPRFLHALELRVRKAGMPDFNKDTPRYNIEVFRDENNGNLVYICETGAIAVVPAK